MTLQELKERVTIKHSRGGGYDVAIDYRGKSYSCRSNNTIAWDDLGKEDIQDRVSYKTDRQCLQAFYDECKRKNNLK